MDRTPTAAGHWHAKTPFQEVAKTHVTHPYAHSLTSTRLNPADKVVHEGTPAHMQFFQRQLSPPTLKP